MTITNKQLKVFKRVLEEFLSEYNKLDDTFEVKLKVKMETISKFGEEVNLNLEKFINRDTSILKSFSLFKRLDLNLDSYDYIHQLYVVSQGTSIDQDIIKRFEESKNIMDIIPKKQNISQFPSFLENRNNPIGSDALMGLVGDIAGQVGESLKGKDLSKINPQELLSGLMSGKNNIGGIDFTQILAQTTGILQQKVSSGEVNLDSLKKEAEGFLANK